MIAIFITSISKHLELSYVIDTQEFMLPANILELSGPATLPHRFFVASRGVRSSEWLACAPDQNIDYMTKLVVGCSSSTGQSDLHDDSKKDRNPKAGSIVEV
jgi:hypothetical protein